MWNQFRQVALTYLTRPTPPGWFVGVSGYIALGFLGREIGDFFLLLIAYLAGSVSSLFLRIQLQWQFNHPRALLTPGFAAPHLLCCALLFVGFSIALPALVLCRGPITAWPVLCSSAVAAAIASRTWLSNILFAPLFIVVLALQEHFDQQTIDGWLRPDGYRRALFIILTMMAWASIVREVMRINRRREDDPDYLAPVVADPNVKISRTFRMGRERLEANLIDRKGRFAQRSEAALDHRIRGLTGAASWKKLKVAFAPQQSILALAARAIWPMAFIVVVNFFNGDKWQWDIQYLNGLAFLAALGVGASAIAPVVTLANRIPQMATERLLPFSNQGYVDAMLGICLWQAIRFWLLIQAAVAMVVFALPWQGWDGTSPATVLAYLIISFAGFAYSFGVGVYFCSMQGLGLLLFAAISVAAATLGLQTYWASLDPYDGQGAALFWAFVFLIAGLGFAQAARWRWRHMELATALSDRFT